MPRKTKIGLLIQALPSREAAVAAPDVPFPDTRAERRAD